MQHTSATLGFISAFLLASVGPLSGCYDPPKVQEQGGSGGTGGSSSSSSSSSSSGSGGAGGEGVPGTCTPGENQLCIPYSGPAQTQNVGLCQGSSKTCAANETWSACSSEVIPSVETCNSKVDTNCDGFSPCTGTPIVASNPPSNQQTVNDDVIFAMAVGPGSKGSDGNVYAVGMRNAISSPQSNEQRILVWNRRSDGSIQDWSNLFTFTPTSQTNNAYASAVGVLPTNGDVIVAGTFYGGTLTISGSPAASSAAMTSFFARISPNGTVISNVILNTGGALDVRDLAIDSADNIFLVGAYAGTPNIPGMSLPTASTDDGFVLRMTPDGKITWTQVFAGQGSQGVTSVAITANKDPVVAVAFTGVMSFASDVGTESYDAGTSVDVLLIRMNESTGIASWSTQLPSTGTNSKVTVGAITANETKIGIGGRFRGTLNLGSVSYLTPDGDTGDAFVATLDSTSGAFNSHFTSQAIGTQEVLAVAYDSVGDLLVAGSFSGSMPLPAINLASAAGTDAYVAKLDTNLQGLWAQKFGDTTTQIAEAVVVGNVSGHIYVGGAFQGDLTGVNPPITSTGGFDAFVLQLGD